MSSKNHWGTSATPFRRVGSPAQVARIGLRGRNRKFANYAPIKLGRRVEGFSGAEGENPMSNYLGKDRKPEGKAA